MLLKAFSHFVVYATGIVFSPLVTITPPLSLSLCSLPFLFRRHLTPHKTSLLLHKPSILSHLVFSPNVCVSMFFSPSYSTHRCLIVLSVCLVQSCGLILVGPGSQCDSGNLRLDRGDKCSFLHPSLSLRPGPGSPPEVD